MVWGGGGGGGGAAGGACESAHVRYARARGRLTDSLRHPPSLTPKNTQKMLDKIVQAILEAWMKHTDPQKSREINQFKVSFRTFEESFKHLFGSYHLIDIYPWRLKEYIYLDKTIREGPVVSLGVGKNPV